jgi:activating signal cointegrator 1
VKALSLTQPWATLVAIGAKQIETRSWGTNYRGWLAIHASKGFPKEAKALCWQDPFHDVLRQHYWECVTSGTYDPDHDRPMPLGAVIAVANLHHVGTIYTAADGNPYVYPKEYSVKGNELAFGDYTLYRKGWILTGVRKLPQPIPCKGALGLWTVPTEIEQEIWRQVKAV